MSDNTERTEIDYAKEWWESQTLDCQKNLKGKHFNWVMANVEENILLIYRKEVIEPWKKAIEMSEWDFNDMIGYGESDFDVYLREVLQKQNPAEQTEKKTASPKIDFPVQFGESATADFEENTWTFEMNEDYKVFAGKFAIVPIERYHKLIANQEIKALFPDELHSDSRKLIQSCFVDVAAKMVRNQEKYGYTNEWLTDDWESECQENLLNHLEKGDPKDVAIYAMFMMYRGWETKSIDVLILEELKNDFSNFKFTEPTDGTGFQKGNNHGIDECIYLIDALINKHKTK